MRTGLIVVGVCFLLSIGIAWRLKSRYGPEWAATQDVFLGLAYFMEAHDGRMPASEEEFRLSGFVETQPDGSIRIKPPQTSRFSTTLRGIPIASLEPFKIRWGTDIGSLTIDDYGRAYDPNKNKVELLCWPSSPPSGKTYTMLLIDVWRQIKQIKG